MSKDFEKEYKTYIQSEIPDLWSRIEQGIKEQNAQELITQEKSSPEDGLSTKKAKKRHKHSRRFASYTTLIAAACICGVILLPLGILGIIKGNGTSMSAGLDATYDYDCAEGVVEEPCVADNMKSAAVEVDNSYEEAKGDNSLRNDTGVTTESIGEEVEMAVPEAVQENTLEEEAEPNESMVEPLLCASSIRVKVESEETAEEGVRYILTVISGDASLLASDTAQDGLISGRLQNDDDKLVVGEEYLVNLYDPTPWMSHIPIYEIELLILE